MVSVRKIQIDDALILRSIGGDREARERLAIACTPKVWRTVYLACRGGPDVEDLVQSALAQAFADLDGFRRSGNFSAWLSQVTVNVIRKHYRRKAYTALLPFSHKMDALLVEESNLPDRQLETRRTLAHLAKHLAKIRPKYRMALVLSLVEGYTPSEIALAVGCNVETARKRLYRGRQALVNSLSKDPDNRELLREIER